jgi:hypothetical protein
MQALPRAPSHFRSESCILVSTSNPNSEVKEMAGRGAPTFLKRQKEQQRAARALAKRAAKQARRENRKSESASDETIDDELPGGLEDQAPETDENPAE